VTPGRDEALRVDVLLDRLCLTRSRSEAKSACDAGAVQVNGQAASASRSVVTGDVVLVRFPRGPMEIEVTAIPPRSTSRAAAREMYRVLRDERTG
jgi:ribosome-associated heat shock protein Hsp15